MRVPPQSRAIISEAARSAGEQGDADRGQWEQLEIQEIDFDGVKIRLVSPRTLYWLKRGTVRDKDRVDAHYLKEKFDLKDEDEGG